jgi:hypothetical protein
MRYVIISKEETRKENGLEERVVDYVCNPVFLAFSISKIVHYSCSDPKFSQNPLALSK